VLPTADFPSHLSATGIFEDLARLRFHSGFVPYEVNLPFWSDGAEKRRWIALPESAGDAKQAIRFISNFVGRH